MPAAVDRRTFLRAMAFAPVLASAPPRAGRAEAASPVPLTESDRVESLLARLTFDEKISMVHGVVTQGYIGYLPGVQRVGIPPLGLSDGPDGIRYGGTHTALPAPVALAATFDRQLAASYGAVLGAESRTAGQRVLLAPGMNMVRTPLGGRSFEYLGEDPRLAAELVEQLIPAIQAPGVIATAKHWICNDQEFDRHAVNVQVDERTLREIYLPPFAAAISSGVLSVMAANNRVRAFYNAENGPLLRGLLKGELGFSGFVVSDWAATHDAVAAANAGLDVDMPDAGNFGIPLADAIRAGSVKQATVDDKVRRILDAMDHVGLLPGSPAPPSPPAPDGPAVARSVAQAGTVLLRNDGLLPLDPAALRSIAVLGHPAEDVAAGSGSAKVWPTHVSTLLAALRSRLGGRVSFRAGATLGRAIRVPTGALRSPGTPGKPGLLGSYFANSTLSGSPTFTEIDPFLERYWGPHSPRAPLPAANFSVRWTGSVTAPANGTYTFTLNTTGLGRLLIDGKLLVNSSNASTSGSKLLSAGKHSITVEYRKSGSTASVALYWVVPGSPEANAAGALQNAVAAAKAADVAVVTAGDSEGEGADRTSLHLPGNQEDLIRAVAAVNPRTVVILNTGAAVLVGDWAGSVAALLQCWYPGQEGGDAVAALLLGEANPSGRLPVTFCKTANDYPTSTAQQYPGVGHSETYSEGVFIGYRHVDYNGIAPQYPFGHGLSYTSFRYSDLQVTHTAATITITNTGNRLGAEVPQLYVGAPPATTVPIPPRQLRGFARVTLSPGQSTAVTFPLSDADFGYWDTGGGGWSTPPGVYPVLVGASSRDIRLTGSVQFP